MHNEFDLENFFTGKLKDLYECTFQNYHVIINFIPNSFSISIKNISKYSNSLS